MADVKDVVWLMPVLGRLSAFLVLATFAALTYVMGRHRRTHWGITIISAAGVLLLVILERVENSYPHFGEDFFFILAWLLAGRPK